MDADAKKHAYAEQHAAAAGVDLNELLEFLDARKAAGRDYGLRYTTVCNWAIRFLRDKKRWKDTPMRDILPPHFFEIWNVNE